MGFLPSGEVALSLGEEARAEGCESRPMLSSFALV